MKAIDVAGNRRKIVGARGAKLVSSQVALWGTLGVTLWLGSATVLAASPTMGTKEGTNAAALGEAPTGPSTLDYEPQPPSIYGEQGPPAVAVAGSGGANVGPSIDTALGRGGIIVPSVNQGENNPSNDVNAGIAAAGTRAAKGESGPVGSDDQGSFPLWPIAIATAVLLGVLNFVFRTANRSDSGH